MDKREIITIIEDILGQGYCLDSITELDGDTCAMFKRREGWTYPDVIYVSSFVENTFLFASDEFNYRFNLKKRDDLNPDLIGEGTTVVSFETEDDFMEDLSEEEIKEIDAKLDLAFENGEGLFWDQIVFQIVERLINQNYTDLVPVI